MGLSNEGVQILSQLNPASAIGNNTIEVELLDPDQVQVNSNITTSTLVFRNLRFTLFGSPEAQATGAIPITLTTTAGTTPQFYTYCMTISEDLNLGVNNFPVIPHFDVFGPGSPHNFERVAYLYNHYGTTAYGLTQPLSRNDSAALQLAMWELLYDTGDSFLGGNLHTVTPGSGTSTADYNAIIAKANFFL